MFLIRDGRYYFGWIWGTCAIICEMVQLGEGTFSGKGAIHTLRFLLFYADRWKWEARFLAAPV